MDLCGELTGWKEDEGTNGGGGLGAKTKEESLSNGDKVGQGFTGTGLGVDTDIFGGEEGGDGGSLDWGHMGEGEGGSESGEKRGV